MKPTILATVAIVATLPFAAAASTLEMRVNDGDLVVSDNDAADGAVAEGMLMANLGGYSGYESVIVNATQRFAPPTDELQAGVSVFNSTGPTSIKVEVTARFINNVEALWPGKFSATANDAAGSGWDVVSYIGSSAYDQGVIGISGSGAIFAKENPITFNASDYWITHVFQHTATRAGISASANVDFIAGPDEVDVSVVPVPAAGVLLLGALGGLGALRRWKK